MHGGCSPVLNCSQEPAAWAASGVVVLPHCNLLSAASHKATKAVLQDHGGSLSLDAYMRLPVEQYYELQPEMIKPLGGNQFALAVPRVNVSAGLNVCCVLLAHIAHLFSHVLQIFSVWVEPLCQIEVTSSENPDVVTLKVSQAQHNLLAGLKTPAELSAPAAAAAGAEMQAGRL